MRRERNPLAALIGDMIGCGIIIAFVLFVIFTIITQFIIKDDSTTTPTYPTATYSESTIESTDGDYSFSFGTSTKYRYVTANLLNIREEPNINSKILTVLPFCTKVEYIDLSEDMEWAKIRYGDLEAYAATKFLNREKPSRYELGEYHITTYNYKDDRDIRLEKLGYGTFIVANIGDFNIGDRLYIDGYGVLTVRYLRDIGSDTIALVMSTDEQQNNFDDFTTTVYKSVNTDLA